MCQGTADILSRYGAKYFSSKLFTIDSNMASLGRCSSDPRRCSNEAWPWAPADGGWLGFHRFLEMALLGISYHLTWGFSMCIYIIYIHTIDGLVLFGSFRIFSDLFGSQEPAAAFCSPFLAQSFNKPLALLASPQAHPRKLGPSKCNVEFWELCRLCPGQTTCSCFYGSRWDVTGTTPKPGIAPTRCEKLTGMVPMPCMDQWIPKNAWDAAGAGFVWKWGSKIPILMRELCVKPVGGMCLFSDPTFWRKWLFQLMFHQNSLNLPADLVRHLMWTIAAVPEETHKKGSILSISWRSWSNWPSC